MAARYDIHIDQGATFALTFAVLDSDEEPVPLTGATATMEARSAVRSTSTLFSISSGSGITIDAANGLVACEITAAVTAEINHTGFYGLELTYSDGAVERLCEGRAFLHPQVNRA